MSCEKESTREIVKNSLYKNSDFRALMDLFGAIGRIYLGMDSKKLYISLGCVSLEL